MMGSKVIFTWYTIIEKFSILRLGALVEQSEKSLKALVFNMGQKFNKNEMQHISFICKNATLNTKLICVLFDITEKLVIPEVQAVQKYMMAKEYIIFTS